jgi:hypothetical protein
MTRTSKMEAQGPGCSMPGAPCPHMRHLHDQGPAHPGENIGRSLHPGMATWDNRCIE